MTIDILFIRYVIFLLLAEMPCEAPARIRRLESATLSAGVGMIHFHIRWSDSKLDWEAFQTREEAIARATELVRPGETYVIAEADGTCPRCKSLTELRGKALTGSELL